MISAQVSAYRVIPTTAWARSTGRVPSDLPITSPVPMNPKTAAAQAGPHPPIHTEMATAPSKVAYGASGPTHGMSNQRSATATVAMAIARVYLTALDITPPAATGSSCAGPRGKSSVTKMPGFGKHHGFQLAPQLQHRSRRIVLKPTIAGASGTSDDAD